MSSKQHHSPEAQAFARSRAAEGLSTREIAEALGALGTRVSHVTVSRWLKESEPAKGPAPALAPALVARLEKRKAGAAPVAPPAAEPPPAPEAEGELDLEAVLTAMLREAQQEAKAHGEASNTRASQAALTRATKLVHVLSQLDKRRPSDPDVFTTSHAQIEKAFAELGSQFGALVEQRGILCQACNRELSCAFGRGHLGASTQAQQVAYLKAQQGPR